MRRMRDLTAGHYVAAAVPVLAAGFGIYYWVSNGQGTRSTGIESAAVIKPSQFERGDGHGTREPAMASDHERPRGQLNKVDRDIDAGRSVGKTAAAKDAKAAGKHGPSLHDGEGEADDQDSESARKPSSVLQGAANDAVAQGAECKAIEYRGDGPVATKVTKSEWASVMDQFHGAKHAILALLEKRQKDLSPASFEQMERQVKNLKIQRPPASDEPDLSWRGIGVYTQNSEGEPIVKLGGGFFRLAGLHPARAKFEMTRLVAQSLAPCELKRTGGSETEWAPLLKCLGVTESQACAQGSYSEAGWAVSTTIAAAVSAPGCGIPAFAAPDAAQCVARIPLDKTVAQAGTAPARDIASETPASPQGEHKE